MKLIELNIKCRNYISHYKCFTKIELFRRTARRLGQITDSSNKILKTWGQSLLFKLIQLIQVDGSSVLRLGLVI